jgi:uncharacterized membrane protein YfcA
VSLSALDYVAVGGAAVAAGMVNALAGGGTLISFPTLVGLGVPAVPANVTNTVSLLPGYLAGTWAQREDLGSRLGRSRLLLAVGAAGGLVGSILLVVIPPQGFRDAVPYLILLSCLVLAAQERLRALVSRPGLGTPHPALLVIAVLATSAYGGFFGAGLGIMLLALLGLFSAEPLVKVNAAKQLLSFTVNLVAAVFFAFSGHVRWQLVPVMAAASIAGGTLGGRLVRLVPSGILRGAVVVAGVAVAISFWVA